MNTHPFTSSYAQRGTSSAIDDSTLLRQYIDNNDGDAFRTIVDRYGGLVYGACLRVTGNQHDAEDATQRCFLSLARSAGAITGALPAWLHVTATNSARDVIRASIRWKNRAQQRTQVDESRSPVTWDDIAEHIDAALLELPEDVRLPIVLHFLHGKTQAEIADAQRVHQSTISRRIEDGVSKLRHLLKQSGLIISVAMLNSKLIANASLTMPPTLASSTTALALAGTSGKSATVSIATGATSTVTTLATAVAIILGGAVFILHQNSETSVRAANRRTALRHALSSPLSQSALRQVFTAASEEAGANKRTFFAQQLGTDNLTYFILTLQSLDAHDIDRHAFDFTFAPGSASSSHVARIQRIARKLTQDWTYARLDELIDLTYTPLSDQTEKGSFRIANEVLEGRFLFLADKQQDGKIVTLVIAKKGSERLNDGYVIFDENSTQTELFLHDNANPLQLYINSGGRPSIIPADVSVQKTDDHIRQLVPTNGAVQAVLHDVDYEPLSPPQLKQYTFSANPIPMYDSSGPLIDTNTVVVVKTSRGKYAKFRMVWFSTGNNTISPQLGLRCRLFHD